MDDTKKFIVESLISPRHKALMDIELAIRTHQDSLKSLNEDKDEILKLETLGCKSCGTDVAISTLTLYDVQAYAEPYGCTGGDYWFHQEYQWVCPDCQKNHRVWKSAGNYTQISLLRKYFKKVEEKE